ncbi:MAG: dihydroneopterin aldolase [Candidatus Dormibacteria bacterium]
MDRIILEGMAFYGYHGDLAAERELGQRFLVDVELGCDLAPAGRSDRLEDTVDYVRAYHVVKELMEETAEPLHLLETVAERLCAALLALPRVDEVRVRVRKHPPLRAQFGHFGVELVRSRTAP